MAYSKEEIESKFNDIINLIQDDGMSLRKALSQGNMPSSQTFYIWLEEDEVKSKQYTRACGKRADTIFEEILDIADESHSDKKILEDGREVVDNEIVQRSRLRIDARKWMLSKMNPKKYGDKVDVTSKGDKIETTQIIGMVVSDEQGQDD